SLTLIATAEDPLGAASACIAPALAMKAVGTPNASAAWPTTSPRTLIARALLTLPPSVPRSRIAAPSCRNACPFMAPTISLHAWLLRPPSAPRSTSVQSAAIAAHDAIASNAAAQRLPCSPRGDMPPPLSIPDRLYGGELQSVGDPAWCEWTTATLRRAHVDARR